MNNEQGHKGLTGYGNYTTLYHTTEKLTGVFDTDVKDTLLRMWSCLSASWEVHEKWVWVIHRHRSGKTM